MVFVVVVVGAVGGSCAGAGEEKARVSSMLSSLGLNYVTWLTRVSYFAAARAIPSGRGTKGSRGWAVAPICLEATPVLPPSSLTGRRHPVSLGIRYEATATAFVSRPSHSWGGARDRPWCPAPTAA